MKQSPSAGVHTFCDRQKPLPDGAAQYYVAGMGTGGTGGTGGFTACTQSSARHTPTPAQGMSSMGCSMELQVTSLGR